MEVTILFIMTMYIPTLTRLVGPVPSILEPDTEIVISPDLGFEQGRAKSLRFRMMVQIPLEHIKAGEIRAVLQVICVLESMKVRL